MIFLFLQNVQKLKCELYISALDHVRRLKFMSNAHLTSLNKLYQYCHAWMILCNVGEVYSFKHRIYILTLTKLGFF